MNAKVAHPAIPPIQLTSIGIQPDYATEINCNTMYNDGEIWVGTTTGFQIINSSKPLNIVATYTTNGVPTPIEAILSVPIY